MPRRLPPSSGPPPPGGGGGVLREASDGGRAAPPALSERYVGRGVVAHAGTPAIPAAAGMLLCDGRTVLPVGTRRDCETGIRPPRVPVGLGGGRREAGTSSAACGKREARQEIRRCARILPWPVTCVETDPAETWNASAAVILFPSRLRKTGGQGTCIFFQKPDPTDREGPAPPGSGSGEPVRSAHPAAPANRAASGIRPVSPSRNLRPLGDLRGCRNPPPRIHRSRRVSR